MASRGCDSAGSAGGVTSCGAAGVRSQNRLGLDDAKTNRPEAPSPDRDSRRTDDDRTVLASAAIANSETYARQPQVIKIKRQCKTMNAGATRAVDARGTRRLAAQGFAIRRGAGTEWRHATSRRRLPSA